MGSVAALEKGLAPGETHGVIGMLERIREPSRPPLGVAPPAALRPAVDAFSLDLDVDELSTSRRRNCSLFMVVMFTCLASQTADVDFNIEEVRLGA